MSLDNPTLYMQNCPDWGRFAGCFGGKIRISDIDGVVEIGGHVLYLEAKGPGASVKQAQDILYRNWCRRGDRVLVLYHSCANPLTVQEVQLWSEKGSGPRIKANTDAVGRWLRKWANWARGVHARDFRRP